MRTDRGYDRIDLDPLFVQGDPMNDKREIPAWGCSLLALAGTIIFAIFMQGLADIVRKIT